MMQNYHFSQFALKKPLVDQLEKLGYINLTPVQNAVIPRALKDESLIVKSATGSGKTHAFLVPIINKLNLEENKVQAIILAPTRELAAQTHRFALEISEAFPSLRLALLAGGEEKSRNIEKLANNPHLIIATPGRLKDLGLEDDITSLNSVNTLVLDEADMLLDSGFFNIIDEILAALPRRQIMVFSATIPTALTNLIAKYLSTSKIIDLSEDIPTASLVNHHALFTRHASKFELITNFIKWRSPYFLLIFASTKSEVQEIYTYLLNAGYQVGQIHGDLTSRQRRTMMRRIRGDEFPIVVASDMAARGIDLDHVSDVLNVNLPNNLEYYFHRAGRAGRYDVKGDAWTFYDNDTIHLIEKISSQGVEFEFYNYEKGTFKKVKDGPKRQQRRLSKEEKALDAKIKRKVGKGKKQKVKPGYKKKLQREIKQVKRQHRKEVERQQRRNRRNENRRKK